VLTAVLINALHDTSPETQPASSSQRMRTYSTADVAKHNNANDCWTIIGEKVYDLTSYVPRHPGGDEILRACGNDGTSLFESRQSADGENIGSGQPHSPNAQQQLESLYIGELR
jgi:cytochrome b involved in lipid metabolism